MRVLIALALIGALCLTGSPAQQKRQQKKPIKHRLFRFPRKHSIHPPWSNPACLIRECDPTLVNYASTNSLATKKQRLKMG